MVKERGTIGIFGEKVVKDLRCFELLGWPEAISRLWHRSLVDNGSQSSPIVIVWHQ
jgi:hypothetical protein